MAKEISKKRKLTCTNCGKEKPPTTGFYLSQSKLYKFNDGRMTICKDCLFEKYDELSVKYGDENKALYHLCMMFDIYFSNDLVLSSYSQSKRSNDKKGLLQTYITKLNSLPQYKGMCSFQSDYVILDEKVIKELEDKYKVEVKEEKVEIEDLEDKKVTSKIKKRWGRGYSDEDYIALEDFYSEYYHNLDHGNDYMKLDIIKEMCTIKLIRDKSIRGGEYKVAREYSTLLSQKMTDAKLKPSQQAVLGEADGDILGMKLYEYETTEPIPKPLPAYIDVDKFWKYILRHMIKPLSVQMGLAQGEYTVDGGDEDVILNEKMQEALDKSLQDE